MSKDEHACPFEFSRSVENYPFISSLSLFRANSTIDPNLSPVCANFSRHLTIFIAQMQLYADNKYRRKFKRKMILEDTRKKFNTYEIKISMVNLWYCLPVSLIPSSLSFRLRYLFCTIGINGRFEANDCWLNIINYIFVFAIHFERAWVLRTVTMCNNRVIAEFKVELSPLDERERLASLLNDRLGRRHRGSAHAWKEIRGSRLGNLERLKHRSGTPHTFTIGICCVIQLQFTRRDRLSKQF